jgi:hypothetical protein
LTSPVHYSNSTICYVSPSQQTDIGTTIEAIFGTDSKQCYFKGALLYKLQRKYAIRADCHPNSSTTSIGDAATSIHLLVVWDAGNIQHDFCVCLIECTDDFIWDKDMLCALHKEYNDQFSKDHTSNTSTWLLHGDELMKTRFKVIHGSDYTLNIVISEGTEEHNMKKPMKIDPTRLVLLLLMLIMLIYAISLFTKPSFKLNIHNQCLNIKLVSPIYFGNGAVHLVLSGQRTDISTEMKTRFGIDTTRDEFEGALLYRLQKYSDNKCNTDTSTTETKENKTTQLYMLVTWKVKDSEPLVCIALVEHAKEFTWNEDELRKLYNINRGWLKKYDNSASYTWFMDDNIALKTFFGIRSLKGNFGLNIFISEEKDDYAMRPLYVDLER